MPSMCGVPKEVGPHRSVIGEGLEGQWHCLLSRASNDQTSLGHWRGSYVLGSQSRRFQVIIYNDALTALLDGCLTEVIIKNLLVCTSIYFLLFYSNKHYLTGT